ncbi:MULTISPECIES: hypothetical protein [unclassified Massilia]|uniref:hypothetical protein n=1 Tax=unclassified Massilia TaxID=2609279 RepID=UPI00068AA7F4|nr:MULTISPECIES: hypothetical protein [unclassified Massilia]ALK94913.2 hypothetical protein AM586_00035 [Massilia sp. WG5]
MNTVLILKLCLVPALIYLVTLVGRRWGPGAAGWVSALPVVAGPILLTMALEQGAGFVATAAAHTLIAVIAVLVFCLAYAWASGRCGVAGSLLAALAAYAAAVAGLQLVELPLLPGFALVVAVLALAPRLFPRLQEAGQRSAGQANDLPLRMLAGALLSFTVTWAAAGIGPRLSGFFAMFPVMGTILVGFSHQASGRAYAVNILLGMARGYYAFATFCVVLSMALRSQSIALAFGMAAGAALLVQLLSRRGVSLSAQQRSSLKR